MFGGNATERRERAERFWYGLGFVAFAGVTYWLMSTDERTEDSHMTIFWICAALGAPVGAFLVWKMADAPTPKEAQGGIWLAFVGVGLNNFLEGFRVVIGIIFGFSGGFFAGAGLGALALVFIRPLLGSSTSTDPPGDSPGN